ncbi:hypothetical protein [Williamsia herbipolensis]|uniref:hypothetical protein n=1 Tax=Williamsia herbipolensis TaxID=1603258 RepID=UPI0005F7DFC1|nr:hypothetical protein [Williamsia herbipolensis]
MTTPRPPRGGTTGKRVPKVAGHTPAKAVPEKVQPAKAGPKKAESKKPEPKKVEAAKVEPTTRDTTAEKTPPAPAPTPTPDATATAASVVETPDAGEWTSADDAGTTATADTDTTASADTATADTSAESATGPRGKRPPAAKVSTIKPQRAGTAAARPAAASDTTTSSRRIRLAAPGWRAVSIVAALAVVFGIIAAISAAKPGVSLSANQAFVDPGITSEVTSQAKSRICSVFAVNYAKMDEWQATAAANVTGEAAQRFSQYNTAVRDALQQTGLTAGGVDCRVDSVGVKSIQDGNALLIVNLIISQTQDQQAAGSGTKRYQVSMKQVNGKWLISNFADF